MATVNCRTRALRLKIVYYGPGMCGKTANLVSGILDWDGPAVSQADQAARHAEVAHDMLARGAAYRCYATPEEIEAFREAARAAGRPPLFHSPWRDAAPETAPDRPFAVRLRAPRTGETVVKDAVQGDVRWKNETLDDLILLRSDGTPTYMLAVVVDDHDMGVTHVIRGDDHLTNAARQTLIYQGMDWRVPVFAHIPLIHGPDGAKLSKRHGALGVEAYPEMGYLPEPMPNYLARLGWSHGDDEFFSTEQAIGWFDLPQIGPQRPSPDGLVAAVAAWRPDPDPLVPLYLRRPDAKTLAERGR